MRHLNGRKWSWLAGALLLAVCCLLCALQRVECSSSYIDEYFLPTAKIALNKLQQSLAASPSVGGQSGERATVETNQSELAKEEPARKGANWEPPNRNEFVQLNTSWQPNEPATSTSSQPAAQSHESSSTDEPRSAANSPQESAQSQPTLLSSTEATSQDPASLAPIFIPNSESAPAERTDPARPPTTQAATQEPERAGAKVEAEQSFGGAGGSGAGSNSSGLELASSTGGPDEAQVAPVDEASVRETESEAVAAVDASIGFGSSSSELFGLASSDGCYDEYGNARFCEPEFENIAFERPVEVSSECGRPASRFCTTYLNEHNDQIRNCHICDAQHPKKRHPAAFLTDINNSNAPTCWVSAPIKLGSENNSGQPALSSGGQAAKQEAQSVRKDNVTLTLNFDKKYELTYVSMQFCSLKADSLAIYKSQDFGQTWQPYQFHSSQCGPVYQMASSELASSAAGPPLEPLCVNSSGSSGGQSAARVAFSTGSLDTAAIQGGERRLGVQSIKAEQDEASRLAKLQDWQTATNLRIVLDRHQASWIQASLAQHHPQQAAAQPNSTAATSAASKHRQLPSPNSNGTSGTSSVTGSGLGGVQVGSIEASLTSPSDTYNYALADLTVGGRCKCNGHASRCVHADDGRLHCDCRHNTAGRDCERCAPFHFDRPWQRATQLDANPCQPCQCNGHSRKCRFDAELYQLSGRRSGGVCIGCRDNTAGRHCHYCKEGFTRDHSKPMSDKEACRPCDCHPVGSLGRVCNQTTGQCPCKEGVTGLECNRCAPGYQQSSSPSEPCIKLPENDINYEPTIEAAGPRDEDPSVMVPSGTESGPELAGEEPSVWNPAATQRATAEPAGTDSKQQSQSARVSSSSGNRQLRTHERAHNEAAPAPPVDSFPYNQEQDQDMQMMMANGFLPPRNRPSFVASQPHRPKHNFYRQHSQTSRQTGPNSRMPADISGFQSGGGDDLVVTSDDSGSPTRSGAHFVTDYAGASRRQPQLYGDEQPVYYQNGKRLFGVARNGGLNHRQSSPVDLDDSSPNSSAGDEFGGTLVPSMSYAVPPAQMDSSSMADDQTNGFNNHIHAAGVGVPIRSQFWQHNNLQFRNKAQASLHHQQQLANSQAQAAFARRRFDQQQQQQHQQSLDNTLACANCQSNSKRLRFKQFCLLDYAIKAQVLNIFMAEDWTRFDVEIQDVFKSPSVYGAQVFSKHLHARQQLDSNANSKSQLDFVANDRDQTMQADDPIGSLTDSNTNTTKNEQQQQQQTFQPQSHEQAKHFNQQQQHQTNFRQYRLKIDSVQSIWVPTEDVACNCPRLQLKTTYLLMGLVDAKENSATSIQLDRHGVALEWKSNLQERLIKYQRRHSKGRC